MYNAQRYDHDQHAYHSPIVLLEPEPQASTVHSDRLIKQGNSKLFINSKNNNMFVHKLTIASLGLALTFVPSVQGVKGHLRTSLVDRDTKQYLYTFLFYFYFFF